MIYVGPNPIPSPGRFASRALFPLNSRPTAEFYQLHIAAHSREDAHPHQPGTRENLVVASSMLELIGNSEPFHLNTGDAIVFGAVVPHSYVNPQKEPCTDSAQVKSASGTALALPSPVMVTIHG